MTTTPTRRSIRQRQVNFRETLLVFGAAAFASGIAVFSIAFMYEVHLAWDAHLATHPLHIDHSSEHNAPPLRSAQS
jgi:hypothetical protein